MGWVICAMCVANLHEEPHCYSFVLLDESHVLRWRIVSRKTAGSSRNLRREFERESTCDKHQKDGEAQLEAAIERKYGDASCARLAVVDGVHAKRIRQADGCACRC